MTKAIFGLVIPLTLFSGGKASCVFKRGTHGHWYWKKIGAGAVPIKTKKGWPEIWHGVHMMAGFQYVYILG